MNYYKEEMNLEIDINKYNQSFKAFESNIQDINSKEPEKYKNYIREFLIESFSISCSNKIKLFISNEIVNTMNILISDKINIFIEYFLDKLKNDFEYYSFLLNQMEELGNSSKISIINLFSNIPKKLNKSIYTFIEDDIFYYIDIFFRENKNIFINNFIEFYLNKEYDYNLTIYKIEDYLKEFISDNNFNKTLNNISSDIITKIKGEIKNNVKNTILTKVNSFNKECDLIFNQIIIKLNETKTSPLTEEMKTLTLLINNHASLLENQNNKYLFSIGKSPFDILNI